jgi:hypothetical protein
MTKGDAYKARHGDAVSISAGRPAAPSPQPPTPADPPNQTWQARAWEFAAYAQAQLWEETGARALAWLHRRGLEDDTILTAGIGYNPEDLRDDPAQWGLQREKKIWLPRGVVIPWFVGADLWRVNIRRPVGDPKYIGPAGFGNALYNAGALRADKPAILVEGELDALTIEQTAGDVVTPCATGSTGGARRVRWLAKLALCPLVLVAFDTDKAGTETRRWWLDALRDNGKHWQPFWGDANDMHRDGADVRGWVIAGLGQAAQPETPMRPETTTAYPVTLVFPGDLHGLATTADWRRLSDGRVEATFPDRDTLVTCLDVTKAIRVD